ncbi:MAG: tetratricopeptide repeat protein [Eubacterium sp.]|nr:tetratricopeptide repeat protein [Eubacterium sp.]
MKKHIVLIIVFALAAAFLTGCTLPGSATKKEKEYREEGIALLEAGEYELAEEMFDKALNQTYGFFTKTELDICFYKALCQYKNGETIDALNTYDGIIELRKKDWRAYYLRGTVYLENGDIEGASADYENALKYNDGDSSMLLQIAANLENAGEDELALSYYEAILELKGKDGETLKNIGWAYYKTGNFDEALSFLESALEKGEETATIYLANINIENGEYETALSLIEDGLSIEDETVKQQLMFAKVICYEYMAEWDNAKAAIEEYVAAYPDDEDGQNEYTFLKNR